MNSFANLKKSVLIAEEGQANQGDVDLAIEMCDIAARSGADGIEFQFFLADDMYAPSHEGYEIYKANELSFDAITKIISHTKSLGLISQVAGLSPQVIKHCSTNGADYFVVNATDLVNPFIIDAVIDTGKPFWLATLMASLNEISWAVAYANARRAKSFGILHGQHIMSSGAAGGVPTELLQLDCIGMLSRKYHLPIGFIDHTSSEFVPALAVAKGATCVTKHLAPYPGWEGPDSQIALEPNVFSKAKILFDLAENASGDSKDLNDLEVKDRIIHRRALYLARSVTKGHILQTDDLVALRPGLGGIDPRSLVDIEGARVSRDLSSGHMLVKSDLVSV
mgnify:CR=1 FL=1